MSPSGSKSFYSKVSGITDTNKDGKNRQQIIRKHCQAGQELILKRELDNPYDPNAIGLWIRVGPEMHQIGYVSKNANRNLAIHIDRGAVATATITELTDGTSEKPTIGVNIEITEFRAAMHGPAMTPLTSAILLFIVILVIFLSLYYSNQ